MHLHLLNSIKTILFLAICMTYALEPAKSMALANFFLDKGVEYISPIISPQHLTSIKSFTKIEMQSVF